VKAKRGVAKACENDHNSLLNPHPMPWHTKTPPKKHPSVHTIASRTTHPHWKGVATVLNTAEAIVGSSPASKGRVRERAFKSSSSPEGFYRGMKPVVLRASLPSLACGKACTPSEDVGVRGTGSNRLWFWFYVHREVKI